MKTGVELEAVILRMQNIHARAHKEALGAFPPLRRPGDPVRWRDAQPEGWVDLPQIEGQK